MATYKMKSTQKGVRKGEVHPVTFEQGKTYEIDDDLAGQWPDFLEESSEEPVAPTPDPTRDDIHENWLDTNSAVLRHGELTAKQVIAKDKSPYSEGQQPADQVEGRAEGEEHADGNVTDDSATSGKSKKSGK